LESFLKISPYVGITGFMTAGQVRATLDIAQSCGLSQLRQLMVGVLVSDKSMTGEPLKPIWANKYPDPTVADELFISHPALLNLVHYNTKSPDLADELFRVIDLMPHLDGFQLNIPWPRLSQLSLLRADRPDLKIVLQLGSRALNEVGCNQVGDSIVELIRRLSQYADLVDFFLIDRSGGLGHEFEPIEQAALIAQLIDQPGIAIRPGIGGGLQGPNLAAKLGPILDQVTSLSWDAEGALRTDDKLDLAKCRSYLETSAELLRG
jgi:hypothetical protein